MSGKRSSGRFFYILSHGNFLHEILTVMLLINRFEWVNWLIFVDLSFSGRYTAVRFLHI